jgi:hypothetical protein
LRFTKELPVVKQFRVLASVFVGLVMFFFGGVAWADSVSSSGFSIISVGTSVTVYSQNCGVSSYLCTSYESSSSLPFGGFSISIPGASLPTGSAIDSATLTFNVPGNSTSVFSQQYNYGPVNPGYYYRCGFFSTCFNQYSWQTGYLNGSFNLGGDVTGVSSPDHSALLAGSSGSIDLIAAGFGTDLAAGDALTLSGFWNTSAGWGYGSTGYNSYWTSTLTTDLFSTPTATLNVDYVPTPEPSSALLLSTGLLSLGMMLLRRRQLA